jgi:hypothetical protein
VQRASFRSETHRAHEVCFVSGMLLLARPPTTLYHRRNSGASSRPYLCPRLRQSTVKDGRCILIRREELLHPAVTAECQTAGCDVHEHP